jgi:PBSX family phage terminase large subunit
MHPVKASGWFNSDLEDKDRDVLQKSGITPVNDIFYPLWNNQDPIVLLFGGYGSGKSVFIQTDLLEKCRTQEYFKCYYGRKVLEDVRGSVHSKFVAIIKDRNLQSEFQFSEEPNGSMIIKHKKTGNMFIPFGASKPDSLKSIDDPTHFFLEEMDQFSQKDFAVILSRLRTTKGNLQLYGAFNTVAVYSDHWIKKMLFPEESEDEIDEGLKELIDLVAEMGIRKLFCNYTDNYFINHQDYYNKLKLSAAGDKDLLEATANGEWGVVKGDKPFATQYDPKKHESTSAVFDPQKQLLIGIDFNLDPFAVTFSHMWRDEEGEHFHTFGEETIKNGSIQAMIDVINTKFKNQLPSCIITGDATGKKRDQGQPDLASYYKQLQRGLKIRELQLQVKGNPTHKNSRSDVNYVLYHFPDFKINPKTCPNTCRDMRRVQVDAFGDIIKKNRNDVNQLADHLDTIRYKVNTFLKKWIDRHQKFAK